MDQVVTVGPYITSIEILKMQFCNTKIFILPLLQMHGYEEVVVEALAPSGPTAEDDEYTLTSLDVKTPRQDGEP